MSENESLPKLDETKLKASDISYMKFIERKNLERVQKLQRIRRNNRITIGLIGAGVLGIYGYSIYSVGRESFLDDFDEPAKTVE